MYPLEVTNTYGVWTMYLTDCTWSWHGFEEYMLVLLQRISCWKCRKHCFLPFFIWKINNVQSTLSNQLHVTRGILLHVTVFILICLNNMNNKKRKEEKRREKKRKEENSLQPIISSTTNRLTAYNTRSYNTFSFID